MISKKDFICAIESLKKQYDIDSNFEMHMSLAFPGSYSPVYQNVLWELAVSLISLLVDDEEGIVSWWVFDCSFGSDNAVLEYERKRCGKSSQEKVLLDTSSKLYDYLTSA